MLEDADLDAAVAEGVLTQAQASSLRELGHRRERERAIALGHEERFRFMRGFNDFFFAVGVVLFLGGIAYFMAGSALGRAAVAIVAWGLAEVLVGRLRLVLPGIILAVVFVGAVFSASPVESWFGIDSAGGIEGNPRSVLGMLGSNSAMALAIGGRALVAAAAAWAFYWRFRLPFTLLLLAASLIGVVLALASKVVPAAGIADTVVFLICALAVFAAAMAFDMSDRERLTRRADCAFWLHLLAAPLIVHSLIGLISPWLAPSSSAAAFWLRMTPGLAGATVMIFLGLAIVAIVIDRRALLVSGLTYLGTAVAYVVYNATASSGRTTLALACTLTLLGALVLILGVGWLPLRRRLLSFFSVSFANRLPPVPARA